MKPNLLYELRVLNGEQRGATSAVRPGDTLRIGRDWSNDVVLQDAGDSAARLLLRDDGSLALQADGGDCAVEGAAVPAGQPTDIGLYTPFTVGDTDMAVGRIGASQWGTLFDDEPAAEAPVAEPALAPVAARRRGGVVQRLLAGGAALVALSAGALTLAWAMGPGALTPGEQVQHLRQTLAHLGFGMLDAEHRDGQLIVTGHLDTQAQRTRLEQALAGQTPARVAV